MQKIAIIFGGQSSEHESSRKSFEYIYERITLKGLRADLQVTNVIFITRDGEAMLSEYNMEKDASSYEKEGKKVSLIDAFKFLIENKLFTYSVCYGQNGEDGRAQGVADFFSMKTNFGNIVSCALGMSKYHLNQYVRGNYPRIKVPKTISIKVLENLKAQLQELRGKDIVVKPNSLGSSVMTEKFFYDDATFPQIENLIRSILQYDVNALIQEYIKGIEYSCTFLEKDDQIITFPAMKIEAANNFYGQKEKFIEGYSKSTIIEETQDTLPLKQAKAVAKEIFLDLNFRNAARFDFIITEEDAYFLEANPLPGLLKGSILTKMLQTKGWDVEKLIEIAFDNEKARKKVNTEYHFKIAQ